MQIVYVLQSQKDGNLYIGCTGDLAHRLAEHNAGRVKSTRYRMPLTLLFHEEYQDIHEAFRMERFYKTATGKRALKKKIYSGIV